MAPAEGGVAQRARGVVRARGGVAHVVGDASTYDASRGLLLARHCWAVHLAPDGRGVMKAAPGEWMLPKNGAADAQGGRAQGDKAAGGDGADTDAETYAELGRAAAERGVGAAAGEGREGEGEGGGVQQMQREGECPAPASSTAPADEKSRPHGGLLGFFGRGSRVAAVAAPATEEAPPEVPSAAATESAPEPSAPEPTLRASLRNGLGLGAPCELVEWVDHRHSDTQAYVAECRYPRTSSNGSTMTHGTELLVVCRGTTSMTDWATDLKVAKTLFEPDQDEYTQATACCAFLKEVACCGWKRPLVHMGFYHAFLSLVPVLRQHVRWDRPHGLTRLTLCGHSLGGALATLSLAYCLQLLKPEEIASRGVQVELYTIGSPRVGTEGFLSLLAELSRPLVAKDLLRIIRAVNDVDIVPRIPPTALGFRHVGDLHLFLESKRDEEPHRGRAVLLIGGDQAEAHEGRLWTMLRQGREVVDDHFPFQYVTVCREQMPSLEQETLADDGPECTVCADPTCPPQASKEASAGH